MRALGRKQHMTCKETEKEGTLHTSSHPLMQGGSDGNPSSCEPNSTGLIPPVVCLTHTKNKLRHQAAGNGGGDRYLT